MTRRRAGALGVALALLAAGCGPSGGVFAHDSVGECFRTLPVASTALHEARAHLVGVHLFPSNRLPPRVRAAVPDPDKAAVCAVAFSGRFRAGQVDGARPEQTGRFAVVVVDARHPRVVASFVGDQLPPDLRGHLIN